MTTDLKLTPVPISSKLGASLSEYQMEIVAGKSCSIFKNGKLTSAFVIGSLAEYDSYNLSYTGVITAITAKRITITAYKGTSNQRIHRLSLYQFCWRNYDFDAEATAKANAETMMYI